MIKKYKPILTFEVTKNNGDVFHIDSLTYEMNNSLTTFFYAIEEYEDSKNSMVLDVPYYITRIESNLMPIIMAVDQNQKKYFQPWIERSKVVMRSDRGWTVVAGRGKNAKKMIKVQTIASFMSKQSQSVKK